MVAQGGFSSTGVWLLVLQRFDRGACIFFQASWVGREVAVCCHGLSVFPLAQHSSEDVETIADRFM